MTKKLLKIFFKTFQIEPTLLCGCEFKNLYEHGIEYGTDVCPYIESSNSSYCQTCSYAKEKHALYPEITNELLLKLICFLAKWKTCCNDEYKIHDTNTDSLKETILLDMIELHNFYKFKGCEKDVVREVQKIFEV